MNRYRNSPILNELRKFVPAYLHLFAIAFFSPLLYLAAPIYAENIMDRVVLSRNESTLWALFAIAAFLILMYSILDHIKSKAVQAVSLAFHERVARTFFDTVHRAQNPSSQAVSDLNSVREFLSGPNVVALYDAIWAPLLIAVMFVVHPYYGYFCIFMVALTSGLTVLNHAVAKGDLHRHQQSAAAANEFAEAVRRNADAARALGMLPRLTDRWHSLYGRALGWQAAAYQRAAVIVSLQKFVRNFQPIAIYTLGALLFLQNEIGSAGMLFALLIMYRAIGPADFVISHWKAYATFSQAVRRLDGILIAAGARQQRVSLSCQDGPLTVSRVVATAPNSDRVIINDISFEVAPSRVLGIVGSNGAGKSCLTRLLVGIWKPRRGSVSLGSHDLSHWDEDELGKLIGYLPQDIELVPGTVAENISRFEPGVSDDSAQLLAASEMAGIQDLIRSLPEGFNTRVGSAGHTLSVGQRQQIGLARALYGAPALVVLDEPNSNIDSRGEQALNSAIQTLKESGSIVVVVTHKLSLLAQCDDILVLIDGVAQAFGSRDQVFGRVPRLRSSGLAVIEGSATEKRA